MNDKYFVSDLLQEAGVTINGNQPWDIVIHNDAFYNKILTNTELTMGETYVDRWWDCPAPDQFFYKILQSHLDTKALHHPKFWRSSLFHNGCMIHQNALLIIKQKAKRL